MYAKVLIDIKHEDVNRFFDYVVPPSLAHEIERGMRVLVPFGNQERMGYVIELVDESIQASKEIIALLDVIPSITDEMFTLIDHIIKQTNDLYAAVFETVVPAEIGLDYYQDITLVDARGVAQDFLDLFQQKNVLTLSKGNHTYDYLMRKYVKSKAITVTPSYRQKTDEKRLYTYTFNPNHTYEKAHHYPKLKTLDLKGYVKHELHAIGFTDGQIKTLLSHEVFLREKKTVERKISHVYRLHDKDVKLTEEQQLAFDTVQTHRHTYQTYVLKGVTGSGKTELYIKWIEEVLKNQQQALVLVPEIALIAPMAQRLESVFKEIVIYHSHLSKGERLDQYMKVKRGEAQIVLGTRSAVFLPLDKLGIIVIDEAHDGSYEQIDRTTYDAITMARLRAKYHQCPLILGSATPSIVSMYRALQKKDVLLELKERPFGIKEPMIELVDMREELKQKNTSMFSRRLKQAIDDRLVKKEQTMILFNRKGYAPFVMCRQCGHVPTCPTCGISLTYYQQDETLKCHYCGHEEAFTKTCHVCHEQAIKPVGVGIEQVERELKKTFPKAEVIRMDANVTKTKGAHEMIWHDFEHEKADILLGTQMIAKGMDFPKVTLVGVLMADMMLKTPSYRASEDAYMLLAQVVGRSGRRTPGEAIIQGYDLEHYAIKDVLSGYDAFYEEALYERKINGYEPFNHVYQVLAEGEGYLKTYQQLFQLKKALLTNKHIDVLGPVPAYIKKKNERYRFIITIKTTLSSNQAIFEAMATVKNDQIAVRFYAIIDQ